MGIISGGSVSLFIAKITFSDEWKFLTELDNYGFGHINFEPVARLVMFILWVSIMVCAFS